MKLIHGHGFNDGKYPTKINSKRLPQYEMWLGMIRRCYSHQAQSKFPAYYGCSVSENFKSYSYFYEWYISKTAGLDFDFCLDKDLLVKGNLIYSEDLCLIVPRDVNNSIMLSKWKRGKYLIGVTFASRRNKFRAQLSVNGQNQDLGYFNTEIEAFTAYKEGKEKYLAFLANKHIDILPKIAYLALIKYKVEKDD